VVAGIIAYLLLPTNILKASFLTDEEKTFAADRLQGKIQTGSGSPDRFEYVPIANAALANFVISLTS
jgi:hypothetical protein